MNQEAWNEAGKITQDTALFTVGLALTVFVTLFTVLGSGTEYPALFILLAGMMGLPTAMQFDKSRRRKSDEGE